MDKMYKIAIVIFTFCICHCYGGQYTVIGGRKLRPFSDYTVGVSWTGPNSNSFLLELIGHHLPGGPFREAQQLVIEPASTKVATFKIGNLEPGNYTLSIRSTSGELFSDVVQLQYVGKSFCAFLHTDKTVYQPGDTIHFRLLALNMYLKPVYNINPQLTLKDGKENVVRRWLNIPLTKGVYSGEFVIAEFPVLGDWSFEIEINGQIYTRKLFVVDFVLPKFLINIETPKHVYIYDKTFTVSVNAMQHTGQDVHGELIVSAYPVIYSGVIQPIFQDPLRKVVSISGKAEVDLNIKDELKLNEVEGNERVIVVEASVEESLTGRKHNTSTIVHLHRTKYNLKYDAPMYYKPNLPYTIQIKVSMFENEDLNNLNLPTIKHSFIGEGENVNAFVKGSCMFDNKGYCQYTFTPNPISNQSMMDLEISYMDLKKDVKGIKSAHSPNDSYMQIKLLDLYPSIGNKVQFVVNSTEPLNFYSYYVIGRGSIVYGKTVQVFPAKRTDSFEFQATQAMAPEATIIITLIKNDKEIIASSLHFKVDGLLQNNVRVVTKPASLELSGNIDITVSASPNSYVALMAGAPSPDFSISTNHHYNGGEGSGLTVNKVLEEVQSFSEGESINHPSKELDAYNTIEIFQKAGVFVMTNNKVNGQTYFDKPQMNEKVEGSTRPPLAGPYAFSHLPPPPAPRLHLGKLPTPTWLYTNITLGGDGKGKLGRIVSENAGMDWSIGAWAIHPTLGLGFAPIVKAQVRPKLFTIAAPEVARIGETIAITATLHNPYNSELYTEITLHNTNKEFKFEQVTNDENVKPKLDPMQTQKLKIESNRARSVVFFITPKVTPDLAGTTISIELTAVAPDISETILHHLTLFPDGEEIVEQITELLDLRNGPFDKKFILKEQKSYDSRRNIRKVQEEIKVGATGSILSPALKLLPKLLELPPASGYHNMLPFMTSVLLLQYLERSDQLSDNIYIRTTGIDVMQKVYQQQMGYRQNDGSFSISSFKKIKGSIWVTGMTAKWMGKAIRIAEVNIQRSIVMDALQWLSQQQSPDGSFRESSTIPMDDKVQQNQVVLTALTLETFIDTKFLTRDEYDNLISKAQDWLARNVARAQDEQWDATILAPLAAVLHKAGHPTASQATNLLNSISNATDGRRWWDLKTIGNEVKNPWRKMGSQNIWVTSWALEALLSQGFVSEALETGKTLVSLLGDWSNLPEDLMALPALIDLVQSVSKDTKAVVRFQCMNDKITFNLDKQTSSSKAQIRQKECDVEGEGYGVVLATMQAFRRTNITGAWPRFTLDPRVDAISTPHKLQLSICVGFAALQNEKESGPVMMKLRLPSGFVPDLDVPALQKGGFVRSAREARLSKMLGQPPLQIVLSPLTAAERCLTLKASRLYPVANERPGVITLVDLTDNSRRARAFFSGGSSSACELCGGAGNRGCGGAEVDLQGGCLTPARQEAPPPSEDAVKEPSNANTLHPIPLILFVVTMIIHVRIVI